MDISVDVPSPQALIVDLRKSRGDDGGAPLDRVVGSWVMHDASAVRRALLAHDCAALVVRADEGTVTSDVLEVVGAARWSVRVVAAPRAWLEARIEALAGAADELWPEESTDVALALAWLRARHVATAARRARDQVAALRATLPMEADVVTVLGAAGTLLEGVPGVLAVRIDRLAGHPASEEQVAAEAELVGERVGALERLVGDARVLQAPLGTLPAALVTVRAVVGAPDRAWFTALFEALGQLVDEAALREVRAERALRRDRAAIVRERALARLQARSARAARAHDSLLSFLSHDIRSPLTVVVGHVQMLAEGLLPPERRAASFEVIRRQTERLGSMAAEVLDAHRGRFEERFPDERVDLGALANDAALRVAALAARRHQRVEVDVADGALVVFERPALGDVVDVLLHATLRRSAEGAAVRARVRRDGDRVVLEVRGEGPAWPDPVTDADAVPGGRAILAAAARVAERGGELLVGASGGGEPSLTLVLPRAPAEDAGAVLVAGPNAADTAALAEMLGVQHTTECGLGPALARAHREVAPAVVVVDGRREPTAALENVAWLAGATPAATVFLAPAGAPRVVQAAAAAGALVTLQAPDDAALRETVERLRLAGAQEGAARPGDADAPAVVRARIRAMVGAARAARAPLPALVLTDIGPKVDEPGRTRTLSEEIVAWVSEELRARAFPGDLLARIDTDAVVLVSFGREPAAMQEIRQELSEQLGRARPWIGVTRVAVRARIETVDLASSGEDPVSAMVVGMRSAAEVGHAS